MHIGMKVRHPELGSGTVKSISEHVADIRFDSGLRSLAPEQSDLKPDEALAEVSGLAMPLAALVAETVGALVKAVQKAVKDRPETPAEPPLPAFTGTRPDRP